MWYELYVIAFPAHKKVLSVLINALQHTLLSIVNKVRLLGTDLTDSRIVQKVLVTVPEQFEATISSLENSKDLLELGLAELLDSLQAQELRRLMRSEDSVEGALQAKLEINYGKKEKFVKGGKKNSRIDLTNSGITESKSSKYPPCKHCGKKVHPPFKCWKRHGV